MTQPKKNDLSRELMHKAIFTTFIPSDPDEVRRIRQVDRLRSAGAQGDKTAIKTLANKEWYEKHKAWKKKYNREYYQNNKDYWQNYYKYTHDAMKSRQRMAKETASEALKAKAQYGENSEQYKKAKTIADANAEWAKEREADFNAAKINLDRMLADEKWYNENTKHMKVTEAWSVGAKQIRDTGKKLIAKLTGWRKKS